MSRNKKKNSRRNRSTPSGAQRAMEKRAAATRADVALHYIAQQMSGLASLVIDGEIRRAREMVVDNQASIIEALRISSHAVYGLRSVCKSTAGGADNVIDYSQVFSGVIMHLREESAERNPVSRSFWSFTEWLWWQAPWMARLRLALTDRKVRKRQSRARRWAEERQAGQAVASSDGETTVVVSPPPPKSEAAASDEDDDTEDDVPEAVVDAYHEVQAALRANERNSTPETRDILDRAHERLHRAETDAGIDTTFDLPSRGEVPPLEEGTA